MYDQPRHLRAVVALFNGLLQKCVEVVCGFLQHFDDLAEDEWVLLGGRWGYELDPGIEVGIVGVEPTEPICELKQV